MAINTRNRRASCLDLWSPNRGRVWPNPDGAFDQADRQQIAWVYSGILAAAPAINTTPLNQWLLFGEIGMLKPYNLSVTVTKSDANDLPLFQTKGILTGALYVGGTGDVNVVLQDNSTVLFSGVPVGTIIPVAARRVNSASTTATLINALYQV